RHEPHQFRILCEGDLAGRFPVGGARWKAEVSFVDKHRRRHRDETAFGRPRSQREPDHRLIRCRFAVWRVMHLDPDFSAARNQLGGVVKAEIHWWTPRHIDGFHRCKGAKLTFPFTDFGLPIGLSTRISAATVLLSVRPHTGLPITFEFFKRSRESSPRGAFGNLLFRDLHDDVMHDRRITRANLDRGYPGVLFERTRN